MKQAALRAIRFYQRAISPRKGFSCAYRVHAGGESCSSYGYRVIHRHGLRLGVALLGRRMDLCAEQHRRHHQLPPATALSRAARRQAGFCDVPCDVPNCDLPGCDLPGCHPGGGHAGHCGGQAWDACDTVGDLMDARDAWRSCKQRGGCGWGCGPSSGGDQDTLDIRPGPDLSDARRRNRRH
jgi:putative component of membrane protein insertase Oxa1/YidC/SpoIIIJ protein YidD